MIVAHVLELESAIRGGSELSWRPNEILSKLDVAKRIWIKRRTFSPLGSSPLPDPQLQRINAEGKMEGRTTVRYDAVNAMMLNEFLKAHHKMEEQGATVARMQKQIEALTARLQKVSAQLEGASLHRERCWTIIKPVNRRKRLYPEWACVTAWRLLPFNLLTKSKFQTADCPAGQRKFLHPITVLGAMEQWSSQ
jgi:hypothetical protein